MTAQRIEDVQEIKEIISAIKKTLNENVRTGPLAAEEIQNHLLRLKDYLTHLDDSQDLLSVVCDFIETTRNLPVIVGNCLQNKLTLKSNIKRLDEEFLNYQQKKDLLQQLRLVSRLDHFESDK